LNKRHVNVYHWLSAPLDSTIGTDEYLYNLSKQKLEEMKLFLETAIKSSIESNNSSKTLKKKNNLVHKSIKKRSGGNSHVELMMMQM
jgi:hypothetical protein